MNRKEFVRTAGLAAAGFAVLLSGSLFAKGSSQNLIALSHKILY
jgi:hypothetical protein